MRRWLSYLLIALRNAASHRRLSAVLFAVLLFTGAALYWAIGFGNAVGDLVQDAYFDCYGDITFQTEPFSEETARALAEDPAFEEVELERELRGMYMSPKRSDICAIVELTDGNAGELARWIKPVAGRLPQGPEEVMIPEVFLEGAFDLGDKLYLVATTKDRIINTIRYTVVGVCKSVGVKGFPTAFLITEESMELLYDSAGYTNEIIVRLEAEARGRAGSYRDAITDRLRQAGIEVKNSWTLDEQLSRFTLYVNILDSLKDLILVLLFPFIGSIIAVIVWFNSHKRRHEIWTYFALGLRDSGIYAVFSLEYYIVAALGISAGVLVGAIGARIAFRMNVWIQFSYTFISPLVTSFTGRDLAFVFAFAFAVLTVWMFPPLARIITKRPFSY